MSLRGRMRAARPSPRVDRTRPAATPVLDGWPSPRRPRGPGAQNPAYSPTRLPLRPLTYDIAGQGPFLVKARASPPPVPYVQTDPRRYEGSHEGSHAGGLAGAGTPSRYQGGGFRCLPVPGPSFGVASGAGATSERGDSMRLASARFTAKPCGSHIWPFHRWIARGASGFRCDARGPSPVTRGTARSCPILASRRSAHSASGSSSMSGA